MVKDAKPDYGLCEWVEDGIRAGFLFGNVQWTPETRGFYEVRVTYAEFPNVRRAKEIKFNGVGIAEMQKAKLRMLQADREWKERNARIGELLCHGLSAM